MFSTTKKPNPQATARTAGALYLAIAVCGAFSIGFVPSVVHFAGDSAQTSQNLLENFALFQLGIVADIALILLELALTAILYVMLKPYGAMLAATALISRTGMIIVMGFILMLNVASATVVQDGGVLSSFDPEERQALVLFLFELHGIGTYVWQVFFGMHLVALGILIVRSSLVPRILGWGVLVGSFGYTLQSLGKLTLMSHPVFDVLVIALLVCVTFAELGLAFWLLIRGVAAPEETSGK